MAKVTREVKKEMSVHADPPPAIVSEPKDFQYETGDQLGKGGFAICHRATVLENGKNTGRIVALKIVKAKMEPAKLAQKFVTELQLHSKLHHPNIVEFHRAFSFQASTYLVLEICDNGSLADAIKKRKYFTMPEIRRFIIQTCGAVKYLHTRNIVHRDLKTGNLFLDKDMNIKVGDFGLAALLVTENDIGKRRTTMCGTPNYLAPEILEKGGKGHNEKVDLWSIGIIAFTLAVGKAPFHAPKKEDIYKKLQARDYSWPDLSTTPNEISNDLHDLVSSLLVHEDDRPSPDTIVSHPFFKMTFIPEKLSSSCTKVVPKWPGVKPPTAETMRRGYTETWFKLCQVSGVGEYAPGKTFQMFGGKKIRSVVRECEKELLAGRQPEVPMPIGMVYVPFSEPSRVKPELKKAELSQITEEKEPSSQGSALAETTVNNRRAAPPRRAVSKTTRKVSVKENTDDNIEAAEPLDNEPLRQRKASVTTRSIDRDPAPVPTISRSDSRTKTSTIRSSARLGVARNDLAINRPTVQEVMKAPKPAPRRVDSATSIEMQRANIPIAAGTMRLVDSDRNADMDGEEAALPTTPAVVLAKVARFRDNIQRALTGRGAAPRRTERPPKMPFVTKWVDYARKHGIGYVLEDGNVGISMNATSASPIVHVVVKDGLSYLHKVVQRPELLEALPMTAYEDRGEEGLVAVELDRKRRDFAAVLWARFGKYMCQISGDDDPSNSKRPDSKPATFVRFYQRAAGVGIWGFSDGCFQLNFPDHTKLVLSSDGRHCDFTYLKPLALAYMKKHGELPLKYMNERGVLSHPLSTLLSADPEDGATGSLVRLNSLRAKLNFVTSLTDEWIVNGGIGCNSSAAEQLPWGDARTAAMQQQKKKDAITLGRYGGDSHAVVAH